MGRDVPILDRRAPRRAMIPRIPPSPFGGLGAYAPPPTDLSHPYWQNLLAQDSIAQVGGGRVGTYVKQQPWPLAFLRAYYAAPGSMLNAMDGNKNANTNAKEAQFAKWTQWSLNNGIRPALTRPFVTSYGTAKAAAQKLVRGIATAAVAATGAYLIGNAVMGGAAAQAGATAAGAAPAAAASTGAATEAAIATGAAATPAAAAAVAGNAAAVSTGALATTGAAAAAAPILTGSGIAISSVPAAAAATTAGILGSGVTVGTVAKAVIPLVAAASGVPIPSNLATASFTDYATAVGTAVMQKQLGDKMDDQMQAQLRQQIAAEQAALVESAPTVSIPTVNRNLPAALQESQARQAGSDEMLAWGIIAAFAVLAFANRRNYR